MIGKLRQRGAVSCMSSHSEKQGWEQNTDFLATKNKIHFLSSTESAAAAAVVSSQDCLSMNSVNYRNVASQTSLNCCPGDELKCKEGLLLQERLWSSTEGMDTLKKGLLV